MNKLVILSLVIRVVYLTTHLAPSNIWLNGSYPFSIPDLDDYDSIEKKSSNLNCSMSYTEDEGEILSPNFPDGYPNDIFCEWSVTVSPNMKILLMVNDLDLRLLDKIYVYDGPTVEHRLLRRYNNYYTKLNAISSGNQLLLQFYSRKHYYSSAEKAFKMKYKAIEQGCGFKYNGTEGIIVSPGYPNNYPSNVKCEWTIHVELNKNILIIFDEFDLGNDHDTLEIGFSKSFSGNSIPPNFISEGDYLKLEFTSGSYENGRAFKLRYKTKDWVENIKFLIFASNAIIKSENSEIKTVAINGHKISKHTDYDMRKDAFVWFEPISRQVHIKSGNNNTKTITMDGRPNSLALDYNSDLIYWIDIQIKTIKVMDINDENKSIYVILELQNENPRDLVINAKKSILVWSDVGFEPKIMYSNMDGSGQNILYSNSRQAFYITIDYQRERYYFIDISDHSLQSIDFEGYNETFYIKSTQYFESINAMNVLDNDLYLANDYMIYRLPEIDLRIESSQVLYSTQKDLLI